MDQCQHKNPLRGYVLGNEYISQVNDTSFSYYLNDEKGSVRYLTGSDGSIRNHYRYSAFGETITAEETVPNRLRYNGQMADGLTGLYYLRARYYNASLGRFTQEDVIYNDGLNLYAYCNSNPVMYSDPSGFAKQCDPKVGGEKDSKTNYGKSSPNLEKTKGWKVGDSIDNLTRAGNEPSWNTVKSRYWKNESYYNAELYSERNLEFMKKGKAPHYSEVIDVPKELHHIKGRNIPNPHNETNLLEVWPWEHDAIDPYRFYTGPRP